MKKNLRIASAAAAALLAVAPVAASTVSTAFAASADVTVKPGTNNPNASTTISVKVSLSNPGAVVAGDSVAALKASVQSDNGEVNLANSTSQVYAKDQFTITTSKDDKGNDVETVGDLKSGAKPAATFAAGDYYLVIQNFSVKGLTPNTDYTINGKSVKTNNDGVAAIDSLRSDVFTVGTSIKQGAPYVFDKTNPTKPVSSVGSVDLNGVYNVAAVKSAIQAKYDVATTAGNAGNGSSAKGSWKDLDADIKAGLQAAGVTVNADNSFAKPSAPFTFTINLIADNGKTGTFTLTVNPESTTGDVTYPTISFKNGAAKFGPNQTIEIGDVAWNYVPVNGTVNVDALKADFSAKVSGKDATPLAFSVDTSKVNTKVAGKYPVVISATNADNKTTRVTFMLTVGAKGATYKTVQSDGDVPVYDINGNTVTDTKTVVKNGDQIAVFGETIKVGDKTYARINSADSTKFVESKYVDGTFKPADKVAKKVMHNAYIYDKDHKRVGTKTVAAYTNINVLGAVTKLADGTLAYQIDDNQYVLADNIDGTVRTLTHNAYVYKTSTKRADRRVLRKGSKVTTFGSPYTFKNGKAYYRIGGPTKQYVKVANF